MAAPDLKCNTLHGVTGGAMIAKLEREHVFAEEKCSEHAQPRAARGRSLRRRAA